jgi:hypothetical protein
VIAALETLKLSTHAQLQSLAEEHEKLKARDTALEAVVLCLEGLIAATRPLRACSSATGAADENEDSVLQGWTELRDEWHRLKTSGAAVPSATPEVDTPAGTSGSGGAPVEEAAVAPIMSGGGGSGSSGKRFDHRGNCGHEGGPGGDEACSRRSLCCAATCNSCGGLAGDKAAGHTNSSSGGGSSAAAPTWARHMELSDGAAAALERYRQYDVAAIAVRLQQYVHRSSVDLYRLQAGAQDAAATARLEEQLAKLMALSAALLVAKPQLLGEVSLYRLDTLAPITAGEGPSPEHWAFVVKQAKFSRHQVRAYKTEAAEEPASVKQERSVMITARSSRFAWRCSRLQPAFGTERLRSEAGPLTRLHPPSPCPRPPLPRRGWPWRS